jgi:hypothetical protein
MPLSALTNKQYHIDHPVGHHQTTCIRPHSANYPRGKTSSAGHRPVCWWKASTNSYNSDPADTPSVELHRFTPCYFLPPALSPAFGLCLYQALLHLQPLSLLLPTLRSSGALPGEVTAVDMKGTTAQATGAACGTLLGQAPDLVLSPSSGLALLSLPLSLSAPRRPPNTKFSRHVAQHPFWAGLRRRRQKAEQADRGLPPPSGGGRDLVISPSSGLLRACWLLELLCSLSLSLPSRLLVGHQNFSACGAAPRF